MKEGSISFDFWVSAETFYTTVLPVTAIVLLVGVMVLLFVFQYAGPKSNLRKRATGVFLSVLFLSVLGGLFGHQRYNPYLEQAALMNPLIRDRERILGFDKLVWGTERRMYQDLNDLEALRKLKMYEEEPVKEYLDYLGSDGYVHYFSDGKRTMKYIGEVQYFNEETHLSGVQFSLIDPQFQDIGFQDSLNAMAETVKINESERNKTFSPESSYGVHLLEDSIRGWNF